MLGSEEIAEATRAFHFEKPEGFTFTPGESIDLFLPEDFPGASDDRQRSFSLASAPHEDGLTIATRMRKSAYKDPLAAAHPGDLVIGINEIADPRRGTAASLLRIYPLGSRCETLRNLLR